MQKPQNGSVVVTAILVVLLIAVTGFAVWAYNDRQDYKNNSDRKVAKAVVAAEAAQKTKLQQQFEEEAKKPYTAYQGSVTFGAVTFEYPKTWSAYIDETKETDPINGYFHPKQVPGAQSQTAYALRLQLVSNEYSQILKPYETKIKQGSVKAAAYIPPKMVGVANVQPGTRLDGSIGQSNKQGAMVVIKVRAKTLQIYTESKDFLADLDNIVLPSLTFVP